MRLFVAIDPPPLVLDQLQPVIDTLPAGRPAKRDQLHLTLFFIGEVPNEELDGITQALQEISLPAFPLRLEGVGCFPNPTRPRILWAGLSFPPSLQNLKNEIDHRLQSLGFAPDKKAFHPHVTLARIKKPGVTGIPKFLQDHKSFQSEEFSVQNFYLYSSNLTPKGAFYTIEKTFPLIA